MSKERLEEIKEIDQEVSSGFALEDLDLNTMTVVNRDHFNWLIEQAERVQELELEISDWRVEVQKWQKFYKESEESHSETKELLRSTIRENQRYKEEMVSALSEIEYALYLNKSQKVKEHYLKNAKRYIIQALEGME